MPIPSTLVYVIDNIVQEELDFDKVDKEIMKKLNIRIDQPQILRDSIFAKSDVLLNELST